MAKKNEMGYFPQKTGFKIVGEVNGVGTPYFFQERPTSTGKQSRELAFTLKTNMTNNCPRVVLKAYSDVQLMSYDKEAKETIRIPFASREEWITKNKDTMNLINGVSFKLGDMQDQESLHTYDGVKVIAENLHNGDVVRIIGDINYSTYRNKKKELVSKKEFIIKKIYKSEVDMLDENFVETSDFKQDLIFLNIAPCMLTEDEKKEKVETFFDVEALIMNYKTLDKINLRVYNKVLAKTMKKHIKPYTSMNVTGRLMSKITIEKQEEEEGGIWGSTVGGYQQAKKKVSYSVIYGVDKDSLDTETFLQADMEKILSNQIFFGDEKKEVAKVEKKEEAKAKVATDDWGLGADWDD